MDIWQNGKLHKGNSFIWVFYCSILWYLVLYAFIGLASIIDTIEMRIIDVKEEMTTCTNLRMFFLYLITLLCAFED